MRHKTTEGSTLDLEHFLKEIRAVVRNGEELLKAGLSGVTEKAAAGARSTDRTVREHPYQTITIVFGLGVLVGALTVGMLNRRIEDPEEY